MKMANIKVIKPKNRHYYPDTSKLHKRADKRYMAIHSGPDGQST